MKAAQSRSFMYRIFGAYLAFPTLENWEGSLNHSRAILFAGVDSELPYQWSFTAPEFDPGLNLEDLNTLFTANFDTGTASVSLHGRSYSSAGDQKTLEELFRFYEYFGLDFTSSTNDFWPDAMQVQLEFMHYLTHLEGLAGDAAKLEIIRAQRDFLKRQLGPLVMGINTLLIEKEVPVYTALVASLTEFVEAESDYLNEMIGDQISLKEVC